MPTFKKVRIDGVPGSFDIDATDENELGAKVGEFRQKYGGKTKGQIAQSMWAEGGMAPGGRSMSDIPSVDGKEPAVVDTEPQGLFENIVADNDMEKHGLGAMLVAPPDAPAPPDAVTAPGPAPMQQFIKQRKAEKRAGVPFEPIDTTPRDPLSYLQSLDDAAGARIQQNVQQQGLLRGGVQSVTEGVMAPAHKAAGAIEDLEVNIANALERPDLPLQWTSVQGPFVARAGGEMRPIETAGRTDPEGTFKTPGEMAAMVPDQPALMGLSGLPANLPRVAARGVAGATEDLITLENGLMAAGFTAPGTIAAKLAHVGFTSQGAMMAADAVPMIRKAVETGSEDDVVAVVRQLAGVGAILWPTAKKVVETGKAAYDIGPDMTAGVQEGLRNVAPAPPINRSATPGADGVFPEGAVSGFQNPLDGVVNVDMETGRATQRTKGQTIPLPNNVERNFIEQTLAVAQRANPNATIEKRNDWTYEVVQPDGTRMPIDLAGAVKVTPEAIWRDDPVQTAAYVQERTKGALMLPADVPWEQLPAEARGAIEKVYAEGSAAGTIEKGKVTLGVGEATPETMKHEGTHYQEDAGLIPPKELHGWFQRFAPDVPTARRSEFLAALAETLPEARTRLGKTVEDFKMKFFTDPSNAKRTLGELFPETYGKGAPAEQYGSMPYAAATLPLDVVRGKYAPKGPVPGREMAFPKSPEQMQQEAAATAERMNRKPGAEMTPEEVAKLGKAPPTARPEEPPVQPPPAPIPVDEVLNAEALRQVEAEQSRRDTEQAGRQQQYAERQRAEALAADPAALSDAVQRKEMDTWAPESMAYLRELLTPKAEPVKETAPPVSQQRDLAPIEQAQAPAAPPPAPPAPEQRRTEADKRRYIQNLIDKTASPEEKADLLEAFRRMEEVAHKDVRTGVGNAAAWAERKLEPITGIVFMDLTKFHDFNHDYGQSAGDQAIQHALGKVFGPLVEEFGGKAYSPKGDEGYATFPTKEIAETANKALQERLKSAAFSVEDTNGRTRTFSQVFGRSFAGESIADIDAQDVNANKRRNPDERSPWGGAELRAREQAVDAAPGAGARPAGDEGAGVAGRDVAVPASDAGHGTGREAGPAEVTRPTHQTKFVAQGNAGRVTVDTPEGLKKLPFHWALAEADQVLYSHDIDGVPRENYPQKTSQERDRSDAASVLQMQRGANAIDPDLLFESPTAEAGAPILRPDGVAIVNGRSAMIDAAYRLGKAAPYRDVLAEKAKAVGVDPAPIDSMTRPALYRVLDEMPADAEGEPLWEGKTREDAERYVDSQRDSVTVHSLDLTPKGREAARSGMPLFSPRSLQRLIDARKKEAPWLEKVDENKGKAGPPVAYVRANTGTTPEDRAQVDAYSKTRAAEGLPEHKANADTWKDADEEFKANKDAVTERLLALGEKGANRFNSKENVQLIRARQAAMEAARRGDTKAIERATILEHIRATQLAEVGRTLQIGRDPFATPEQRMKDWFDAAILQPKNERVRKGLENKDPKAVVEQTEHVDKLLKDLKKAGLDTTDWTPEQAKDVSFVAKQIRTLFAAKAGISDKAYEFWCNGLLSGLGTHAVNTASNVASLGWEYGVHRPLQAVTGAVVRGDTVEVQGLKYAYLALLRGVALREGTRNFKQAWETEANVLEQKTSGQGAFGGGGKDFPRVAIGGKTGRVIRVPYRFLRAADEFAKGVIGQMEAAASAYKIAKGEGLKGEDLGKRMVELTQDYTSEAWAQAVSHAELLTFQKKMGAFGQSYMKLRNANLPYTQVAPLKYITPFVTTPFNIFKQALAKSPVGLPVALHKMYQAARSEGGFREAVRKGTPEGDAALRAMTEQIMAWGAATALTGILTNNTPDDGLVITGPVAFKVDDRGEREAQYRSLPPSSLVWKNKKGETIAVNYGRIEPFATTLGTLADAAKILRRGKNADASDKFAEAFKRLVGQLRDKTFLKGVGDIIDAAEGPDKFQRLVTNFASSWMPNIVKQPLRAADEKIRETRVWGASKQGQGGESKSSRIIRRMGYSTIPAEGFAPPARRDVLGHETTKLGGGGGAAFAMRLLSPVQFGTLDENTPKSMIRFDHKMLALQAKDPKADYFPRQPEPQYKTTLPDGTKKTVYMSDKQREQFEHTAGRFLWEKLKSADYFTKSGPLTADDADRYEKDAKAAKAAARKEIEKTGSKFLRR